MGKTSNLGVWTPFLGNQGRRTTLVDGSLESQWSTFYSRWLNFFRYPLRFRSYEAKCVQLGCFRRGSIHLHSNLTWSRSSPSTVNHDIRKLETPGYLTVKTTSRWVPSFWHNTGVWRTDRQTDRRTDGRICRSIYITALAKLALRSAVKM